jgi:putative FmdB family regulatory protein
MPKYDFKCTSCQEVSDAFFPIQDGPAPAIVCKCGGEAFRVHSAPAAHFKGGGWGGSNN